MELEFTWDESKRISNLAKHGLDFLDAALIFEGPTFTFEDQRDAYFEQRFVTLGFLHDQVVYLGHTEIENQIRCISFRSASSQERRFFREKVAH